MADNKLSDFDASFLKDLADIIKNKTLFFIPFFGAFLAFLFAKTDYIKSANFIIWIAIILLFLACIRYISLVSQLLWGIESARFVFNWHKARPDIVQSEKDKDAVLALFKLIPEMASTEDWWFRKIMLMMYLATFMVLSDIFIGKWISQHLLTLLSAYVR